MKNSRVLLPIVASVTVLAAACQGSDISSPLGSKGAAQVAQLAATPTPNTVFPVDVTSQVTCANGTSLNQEEVGRIQMHTFSQGNSNILEMDSFHVVITFTNAAGQSYTWRDVGPDKISMQDGKLVLTVTGRAGGMLGTFTIDPFTGTVLFSSGPALGSPVTTACAALS
jgi:hypothetical protein